MSEEPLLGREEFLARVLERFPELRPELDLVSDLLHCEMGAFSTFTNDAIEQADWPRVDACFLLAEALLSRACPELENALYVSFVENLHFLEGNGPQAFDRLPPGLHRVWQELEEHFAMLEASHEARLRQMRRDEAGPSWIRRCWQWLRTLTRKRS